MATEEVGLRLTLQGRREAAAGLSDVKGELEGVADAGQDVEAAGQAAARGLDKATDRRFARGFAAIGRGATGVIGSVGRGILTATRVGARGLGILSAAAGIASVKAIGLQADARETASAFNTVFGPSARGVAKDLGALTYRFGLYNPELKDATRQFGVFGKAAGIARKDLPAFSTGLVKAGLDLSSFYNTDPGETFQALQSGLSGEAEPLRKFGIFISDATLKAKAASMGLTGELTEQQKVMIRQRLIMAGLGDAQGDLARTSDGFANQQRGATGRIKQLLTTLGGPLTTAATGAFRGLNTILKVSLDEAKKRLPGLEQGAGSLSKTFERWGRSLADKIPSALDRIATTGDRVKKFFKDARSFVDGIDWGNTSGGLTSIGTAIDDTDWGALGDGLGSGVSDTISVFNVVIGFAADNVDTLAQYLPTLVVAFAAYKTAQAAANVVALASLPIMAGQVVANIALARSNSALAAQLAVVTGVERTSMVSRLASTVATIASTVATTAASAATKAWAAVQWLLNAALTANPIGLVIAAIALLVGGFILAYQKSDTFRGVIDKIWGAMKVLGGFIGSVFLGYLRLLATGWLTMGIFGLKAFRWLLTAAFKTFDGILSAAEKGLGWVPELGDKIRSARASFDQFGDATIAKLQGVEAKLRSARDRANELGRDRDATITITTVYRTRNEAAESTPGRGPDYGDAVPGGPSTRTVGGNGRVAAPVVQNRTAPAMPDLISIDDDDDPRGPGGQPPAAPPERQPVYLIANGRLLAEVVVDEIGHLGSLRG